MGTRSYYKVELKKSEDRRNDNKKRGKVRIVSIEDININPAIKYLQIVIPAKAGIQKYTGCRIKSGMTEGVYLIAGLIFHIISLPDAYYRLQMMSFYFFNQSCSVKLEKSGGLIFDPFGLFKRFENKRLFKFSYRRTQAYAIF